MLYQLLHIMVRIETFCTTSFGSIPITCGLPRLYGWLVTPLRFSNFVAIGMAPHLIPGKHKIPPLIEELGLLLPVPHIEAVATFSNTKELARPTMHPELLVRLDAGAFPTLAMRFRKGNRVFCLLRSLVFSPGRLRHDSSACPTVARKP